MSCRSSLSFMITASRVGGARSGRGALPLGKQYRDERGDGVGWILSRDDGEHMLTGPGWLQVGELGAEKLLGEEVTVPGGEPPGQHLAVRGQEDHLGLRAAAQQRVPVGALEGRAGDDGR